MSEYPLGWLSVFGLLLTQLLKHPKFDCVWFGLQYRNRICVWFGFDHVERQSNARGGLGFGSIGKCEFTETNTHWSMCLVCIVNVKANISLRCVWNIIPLRWTSILYETSFHLKGALECVFYLKHTLMECYYL